MEGEAYPGHEYVQLEKQNQVAGNYQDLLADCRKG